MVEKCWLFLKPHESFRWNRGGGKQGILNQHWLANSYFSFVFSIRKVGKMCELAAACVWNWSLHPPKLCKLVETPARTSWLIHGARADTFPAGAGSPKAWWQPGLWLPLAWARSAIGAGQAPWDASTKAPATSRPPAVPSMCRPGSRSLGPRVTLCPALKGKATLVAAERVEKGSATHQAANWPATESQSH